MGYRSRDYRNIDGICSIKGTYCSGNCDRLCKWVNIQELLEQHNFTKINLEERRRTYVENIIAEMLTKEPRAEMNNLAKLRARLDKGTDYNDYNLRQLKRISARLDEAFRSLDAC